MRKSMPSIISPVRCVIRHDAPAFFEWEIAALRLRNGEERP
ncbi:hypothetical protein D187_000414 [Cystobacter fuscus DSM 2262]|uniref:Uncharacterized protein n=1 Tax=Cystobacter fuscus (strain ATCC 25194 / DSM 2262 / NBRC 100088 / M29) TaxID=1242864 RepID=S9QUI9_CYSF2|nr:hypothetical protein D187_000414 [Cystobacter fuscus DSM 2262]